MWRGKYKWFRLKTMLKDAKDFVPTPSIFSWQLLMKDGKAIFCLILIIAFFLRFYRLGQVPPSLDWDEASLGYNAYSILKTGKDEYGERLPLSIRSFGDYKPPLYVYLTIPSVAVFGPNEFAVRFPSAFLGTLTVLLTYFLVNELFTDLASFSSTSQESRSLPRHLRGVSRRSSNLVSQYPSILISLLSSFLLAISPWHLQFSRVAFESNLGLFLTVLGVLFFLKSLRRSIFWPFSFLIFGFSLFSYHTNRLFTPLLIFSLCLIYRKEIWTKRKWFLPSVLIFLLFIPPLLFGFSSTLSRARGVSVFAQPQLLTKSIIKIEQDINSGFSLGRVIHNRRLVYLLAFLKNYFSHFDFNWLFLTGDNPRHHAPGVGILYLFELPLIFLGILKLWQFPGKTKWVIFTWFLFAPVASSFSTGVPHAVRSLVFLPTFQIFAALGFFQMRDWAKKTGLKGFFLFSLFSFLFSLNIFYFFHQYFIHLNDEYSAFWQYGYKEVVLEVASERENYSKIFVTTEYDQPYIFFLFYLKYPPQKYQGETAAVLEPDRYHREFDKFIFVPIKWDKMPPGSLVVGAPDEIPDFANIQKKIYFLDGKEAFRIAVK